MNDPMENRMRELAWRRQLTEAERLELRAWLKAHPEAQADWETEMQLSGLMNRPPDAPVASNFTAGVLQEFKCQNANADNATQTRGFAWLHRFVPRAAVAALVVSCGLVFCQHHDAVKRKALAQELAAMTDV